jgi:1,4-alpha-glucan branching enzyme
MFAHPGKKLLFMGCEIAQEREWNHDHSLDWHLLDQPPHAGVQRLLRDLNHRYRELPALHELDCDAAGFEWIVGDDADRSVFVWLRKGRAPNARCLAVMNFTPEVRRDYRIKVPIGGPWREILNTDAAVYGGGNVGNEGVVVAINRADAGAELTLTLPPLATIFLVPEL